MPRDRQVLPPNQSEFMARVLAQRAASPDREKMRVRTRTRTRRRLSGPESMSLAERPELRTAAPRDAPGQASAGGPAGIPPGRRPRPAHVSVARRGRLARLRQASARRRVGDRPGKRPPAAARGQGPAEHSNRGFALLRYADARSAELAVHNLRG